MENDTLLKNFAWLCFISNTLCVIILVDYIFFGKPYVTAFSAVFSAIFYFNYKFLLFCRSDRVMDKLGKFRGVKLSIAFFRIYFLYARALIAGNNFIFTPPEK